MTPYSSGQGCKSAVFTANTAGTQIGLCGTDAASAAGAQKIAGYLHTITFSSDSTSETITIYDGSSTSGNVLAKIINGTSIATTFTLDLQADTGLFIVISGGTTVAVTVTYA